MIFHLAQCLKPYLSIFNVVHYVSFRAMAGLLSTLLCSILFGGWFIDTSKKFFRSAARPWTPETHRVKDDMPTMGGLFIIAVVIINTLLWCNLYDVRVWLFLVVLVGFGLIGFWDDWAKIRYSKGISARVKFSMQSVVALVVMAALVSSGALAPVVCMPFFKYVCINLGLLYIAWGAFVIVGCSNAVNLTDGLDGLAIGSLIPNFATFTLISYIAGHKFFAWYLQIPFAHSDQMAVVGSILVGASLGFLWYNTYPAQIFMGDVGSLALGAALAYMALVCKQELLLPIAGGLFVIETLSVIIQVLSYKLLGRKWFKMAPIHHHFELLGWPESRITTRFIIISLVLCLCALITLKLR